MLRAVPEVVALVHVLALELTVPNLLRFVFRLEDRPVPEHFVGWAHKLPLHDDHWGWDELVWRFWRQRREHLLIHGWSVTPDLGCAVTGVEPVILRSTGVRVVQDHPWNCILLLGDVRRLGARETRVAHALDLAADERSCKLKQALLLVLEIARALLLQQPITITAALDEGVGSRLELPQVNHLIGREAFLEVSHAATVDIVADRAIGASLKPCSRIDLNTRSLWVAVGNLCVNVARLATHRIALGLDASLSFPTPGVIHVRRAAGPAPAPVLALRAVPHPLAYRLLAAMNLLLDPASRIRDHDAHFGGERLEIRIREDAHNAALQLQLHHTALLLVAHGIEDACERRSGVQTQLTIRLQLQEGMTLVEADAMDSVELEVFLVAPHRI
mmetsp:Transcript_27899/g.65547  ORF Transcript_27899/g.65547 Transcript_27899/m.65547 type:complete len:388 (-) Transcript_27899:77-1240(-)